MRFPRTRGDRPDPENRRRFVSAEVGSPAHAGIDRMITGQQRTLASTVVPPHTRG